MIQRKDPDPQQNEICKYIGCEQANKTEVEKITEGMKKEVLNRPDQLMRMSLHEINLVKAIVYRVVPVAAYVMNVRTFKSKVYKQY